MVSINGFSKVNNHTQVFQNDSRNHISIENDSFHSSDMEFWPKNHVIYANFTLFIKAEGEEEDRKGQKTKLMKVGISLYLLLFVNTTHHHGHNFLVLEARVCYIAILGTLIHTGMRHTLHGESILFYPVIFHSLAIEPDVLKRDVQMTLSQAFAYRGCHLFYLATETKGLAFDKKPTYKGGHIMLWLHYRFQIMVGAVQQAEFMAIQS